MDSVELAGIVCGSPEDLTRAPLDALRDHLRFELDRAAQDLGSLEALAHQMGYETGSQVSKIRAGSADLPLAKARFLDSRGISTTLGVTWSSLVEAIAVRKTKNRNRTAPIAPGAVDVFLAVPMASTSDDAQYEETRRKAHAFVTAIETYCAYSVYCAALQVGSRKDFDAPGFALTDNTTALAHCRRFVLFVPEVVEKPSSVWVEAGLALAWQKPSTYFVPHPEVLPYILQQAADVKGLESIGTACIHWIDDDRSPASLVRRHGPALFNVPR
jgi:hypothetical protein